MAKINANLIMRVLGAIMPSDGSKSKSKIVAVVAVILSVFLIGNTYFLNKDNDRLSDNQKALTDSVRHYMTENGTQAMRIRQLELTAKEYMDLYNEGKGTIEELNVKVKRLEHLSKTAVKTEVRVETVLRDTVIVEVESGKETKAMAFDWNDGWNNISGTVYPNDSVVCGYEGTDTLTVACVKVPKKFLFFRFGCKYVDVSISNRNPKSRIVYNQTVKFK